MFLNITLLQKAGEVVGNFYVFGEYKLRIYLKTPYLKHKSTRHDIGKYISEVVVIRFF